MFDLVSFISRGFPSSNNTPGEPCIGFLIYRNTPGEYMINLLI